MGRRPKTDASEQVAAHTPPDVLEVEVEGELVDVYGVVRLPEGYAVIEGKLPVESMRIVHSHLALGHVPNLIGALASKAARRVSDFYRKEARS